MGSRSGVLGTGFFMGPFLRWVATKNALQRGPRPGEKEALALGILLNRLLAIASYAFAESKQQLGNTDPQPLTKKAYSHSASRAFKFPRAF